MSLFRLSAPAMPGNPSAREIFPKNLTIRFGARRSSIYGSNSASKTAPLTAAAKDQVRESHAKDLTSLIRPMILDEEFPDYQKLLDVDKVDTRPPPSRPESPLWVGTLLLRQEARRRPARDGRHRGHRGLGQKDTPCSDPTDKRSEGDTFSFSHTCNRGSTR